MIWRKQLQRMRTIGASPASAQTGKVHICPPAHQSTHLSINPSIHPSIHLSIHLSVQPCSYPSTHLSVHQSVYRSLSIHPSIQHLSLHPPVHPSYLDMLQMKSFLYELRDWLYSSLTLPPGPTCEIDINECVKSLFCYGAVWHNTVGSYQCNSLPGYSGQKCETDIDDCTPSKTVYVLDLNSLLKKQSSDWITKSNLPFSLSFCFSLPLPSPPAVMEVCVRTVWTGSCVPLYRASTAGAARRTSSVRATPARTGPTAPPASMFST